MIRVASNKLVSVFIITIIELSHYQINFQPLTHLFSLLAAYFTAHHTYFAGCETKNTAYAGFPK
ncbi:hypothetical protein A4R26_02975 [Niastella populi]|uniref:Uncharacterized protein n=1 Tax=Niastella populi TaxID=550983 RepID=A0A1V9FJP6_9BACT|nr:hypothetical protein A4R26_02975 [Niastella populi]